MLQLNNIKKSYTTASFTQVALDDVSISFRENEFVAILGPSGSGKTTMLNIIGGLDQYDSGDLIIDGVSTKEYKDRDWDTYRNNRIGFVFQSYNLIPHQTVLANVELALTLSGVDRAERRQRAIDALKRVGLEDHVQKRPSQLSGGQMQRVAVARALINNPEILLADEPTGALDSTTSVQIMELLEEIAKERLVIMVTHNPELADTYATRTINLRDGKVIQDSDPFSPVTKTDEESDEPKKAPTRRASMSFFTAIALSFNNLMTKLGRTTMTAFAGSIGIIGIALILSLSNGVNSYIKGIEEEALSLYPLTIESTGFDMTSIFTMSAGLRDDASSEDTAEKKKSVISESRMAADMISGVRNNDLKSLKDYLEEDGGRIHDYVSTISYDYGVTPLIFSNETTTTQRQLNPNTSLNTLLGGGVMGGAMGEFGAMFAGSSTLNAFYPMHDNLSMLESQYDVVAGKWATKADECILVLGPTGNVSDFVLFSMGLRDQRELDDMVRAILNEEEPVVEGEALQFTPKELMAPTFKIVNRSDTYVYDEKQKVWVSKIDNEEFMKGLIEKGTELRIVGIVQAAEGATATSLQPGLAYSPLLQRFLIDEAHTSPVVQDQIKHPELNVISGRTFADELENPNENSLDFASLFGMDFSSMENLMDFDMSGFEMPEFDAKALESALDPSQLQGAFSFDPSTMQNIPPMDITKIAGELDAELNEEELSNLINLLMTDFTTRFLPTYPDPTDFGGALTAYFNTPEATQIVSDNIGSVLNVDSLTAQVQNEFSAYIMQVMQGMMGSMEQQLTVAMTRMAQNLTTALTKSLNFDSSMMGLDSSMFNFDSSKLSDLMTVEIDPEQIRELMVSMLSQESNNFESNLRKFDYADYAKPTAIDIYPRDFESKEKVVQILDDYNKQMEKTGHEDRTITYVDIVGTLMSSVTTIIDMIGYVLIAFVSISLVVSSIMIGIITYISVLERKKEIGVLRSIGASKGDVGRVFTAETLIVGLAAGLLGVGTVALMTIPINIIVENIAGVPNITILPWKAALILVAISMFLSFVAGLIPSSAASRRDPVEALRSE